MPSRPDPHDTGRPHVVVIGAGIIGATLAYELAGRGARVTVLDRERPAAGATGVAFAWLTNQTYFRNGNSLSDGGSRHYFGLHRLALGAWRRLHHRIGDDLGVRWHGAVQLAPEHGEDHDLLERDLARRLAWGSPSYRVTAAEARTLVPGLDVDDATSGFYTPDEGSVDPNAAVAAVLEAAAARGVHVERNAEVQSVEGAGGHATAVRTAAGRIDCDHVVVAAGADSGVLLGELGITAPLVESSGSIVHLAPLPAFLDPVLLGPTVHAIQRRDGRVVIARHYSGSPVGDPDHLDAPGLLADTAGVLPPLRQAEIEKVTVGRRIIPADGLPIIGRSPVLGNVHSVTTNAGITLGPVLAQLMTTEILDGGEVDVLAPYRADRFGQTPG